jgi:hypothetical protein
MKIVRLNGVVATDGTLICFASLEDGSRLHLGLLGSATTPRLFFVGTDRKPIPRGSPEEQEIIGALQGFVMPEPANDIARLLLNEALERPT